MKLPALFKRKSAADKVAEREAAKHAADEVAVPKKPAIDFKKIAEDFQTLDPKDPGLWPLIPKVVILAGLFVALLGASWWFGWNVQMEELAQKEAEEATLKEDWLKKKQQAVNLDEHKAQLAEINNSFGALLKQLPNQSEIGDLLLDINKAGQSRGLLVDFFKPGSEARKDFYAELPISLQLTGSYHDMGGFAGDIAQLPRIVTLNDIELASGPGGQLVLKTTAKTFRYLDEDEIARARREQKGGRK